MRTKELCWWHLTFGCFPARPSCPHRGSLSGWGVSLRILINVLILDWKPNYPNPHHVSINLHLEKTSKSRPQNLHHHLTWIQLQDLVSLIQILKWIYSACMSWSEKGQLTSERKQTTARDKTRSDHSSDIASLWTVTHQDGFCVWIRCCCYSHAVFVRQFNCICETASHCICIGGVCHISRWKQSWNKLFCYLRSHLYLVFGCRNLIISEEWFVFVTY